MKTISSIVVGLALLAAVTTTVRAAAAMTQAQRLDVVRAAVAREVSVVNGLAGSATPVGTARDMGDAALGVLELNQDPKQAAVLLRAEFSAQAMDPKSPDFGQVPWQLGRTAIHDPNSVEFALQPIGPILLGYSDKLGPDVVADLKPHVVAGLAVMRARHIKALATSIWLMRCESFVLCGEALGDQASVRQGSDDLDSWLAYAGKAGIHEFDSPIYYAIDLNSLGLGYRYATDPAIKVKFKSALDLFWSDICANYFSGRQDLSGPHSRDDELLSGAGDIDNALFLVGLRDQMDPAHVGPQAALMLASIGDAGCRPSPDALRLAGDPDKLVQSMWQDAPALARTNYITPDYAIGSSDGDYGATGKPVDVELPNTRLPVVSVVPDQYDQPYGSERITDAAGFRVHGHLPMRSTCVQAKNVVLGLFETFAPKTSVSTLATDVILPAAAELRLDGRKADTTSPFVINGRVGSVVLLRAGSAAVAIRVFHADGHGKQPPMIALKADPVGLKYGAARLAIYHYAGAGETLKVRRYKVGLLIVADKCAGIADEVALIRRVQQADVEDVATAHDWTVTAKIEGHALSADIDLTGQDDPVRTLDGAPAPAHVLTVNGNNLAAQILGVKAP
jgi:hypothetical protein